MTWTAATPADSYRELGDQAIAFIDRHGPSTTKVVAAGLKLAVPTIMSALLWLEGRLEVTKDLETGLWSTTPERAQAQAERNARAKAEMIAKLGGEPVPRPASLPPKTGPTPPVRVEEEFAMASNEGTKEGEIDDELDEDGADWVDADVAARMTGRNTAKSQAQALWNWRIAGRMRRKGVKGAYRYSAVDIRSILGSMPRPSAHLGPRAASPPPKRTKPKAPSTVVATPTKPTAPPKASPEYVAALEHFPPGKGSTTVIEYTKPGKQVSSTIRAMRYVIAALEEITPEEQHRVIDAVSILLGDQP